MEFDTKLNPSRDLLVAEFPCNTANAVKPAGVALVRARFYHILPFVISDIDHWRAAIRTDCVFFFFVKSCPAAYISIDHRGTRGAHACNANISCWACCAYKLVLCALYSMLMHRNVHGCLKSYRNMVLPIVLLVLTYMKHVMQVACLVMAIVACREVCMQLHVPWVLRCLTTVSCLISFCQLQAAGINPQATQPGALYICSRLKLSRCKHSRNTIRSYELCLCRTLYMHQHLQA